MSEMGCPLDGARELGVDTANLLLIQLLQMLSVLTFFVLILTILPQSVSCSCNLQTGLTIAEILCVDDLQSY